MLELVVVILEVVVVVVVALVVVVLEVVVHGYTQYELYGTSYMGRILRLVEILEKIRDTTRLCDRK